MDERISAFLPESVEASPPAYSGAAEAIAAHCSGHDYDDPGKPAIAWDDPAARAAVVAALVGDAFRVLGHLLEQQLGPPAAEVVALLALVAGQDVEPAAGSDGRWKIARTVTPTGSARGSIPRRGARTEPSARR